MLCTIAAFARPGALELRLQIRPARLDCVAGEAARITVEDLLLDHIGQPSGSLLVVDAEGRAAAEAFAADDPCCSKRVFERVEIRRWRAAPGWWIG